MRVGVGPGVRVRDRDTAESLPAGDLRRWLHVPVRVLEVGVIARVAMRPAVHGDGEYVARRSDAATAERAVEDAAHFALIVLEAHPEHAAAVHAGLVRHAQPRSCWLAKRREGLHHAGVFWPPGRVVIADVDYGNAEQVLQETSR